MNQIAVLIMAAGEASRFGGCKLLAHIDDKSLLQRAIDESNAVAHGQVYVVTGRYHNDIHQQVTDAQLLYNPHWQDGLGRSIAYGASSINQQIDGILILLADQIRITQIHLRKLIEQYDETHIVCANYEGKNGVPALFPKRYFDTLQKLQGDKGAKLLLNNSQTEIISLSLPEAVVDIDTSDELVAASSYK